MRLCRLPTCAILLLMLIMPVLGEGHLMQVGTIPLGTMKNLIWNDTLYTMEGNAIRATDISPGVNLAAITAQSYEGQVFLPQIISGLNISGGSLYAAQYGLLSKISLSDKLHPTLLGTSASKVTSGKDVVVEGNFAYIAGSNLYIYDITNEKPVYVKTLNTPFGQMSRLVSDGNYLYGGYEASGVVSIWDISIPGSPIYVNNFTYSSGAPWTSGLSYHNNTLFLSQYKQYLLTIDVTNRSKPAFIKNITLDTVHNTVSGKYLYTSVRYDGIRIFDISNNTPVLVSSQTTSLGYSEQISSNGNIVAVSRWTGGTKLYNIANKKAPTSIININSPGEIFVMQANTLGTIDILATGGRNTGNWYWNITNPEDVNLSGYSYMTAFSPGNPRTYNIPWVGNYSYSTAGGNGAGAYIINLTGLEKPGFSPPYKMFEDTNIMSVYANASWIFGVTADNQFRVYDNSFRDTAVPTLISSKKNFVFGGDGAQFFPYRDNYFLTRNGTNIAIINMKNAKAPTIEKEYNTGYSFSKINYDPESEIVYGLAYDLASNTYSIRQIDVAEMNNMHLNMGSIVIADMQARNFARNGTDIFVVGRLGKNVKMYSFDNPQVPRLVDSIGTMEGDAEAVVFYKGYLYTAFANILTVYKVIPSSDATSNLLQQTIESQDQKPELQSTSSVVVDQNLITRLAGLWNRGVNFLIRHFPFHL